MFHVYIYYFSNTTRSLCHIPLLSIHFINIVDDLLLLIIGKYISTLYFLILNLFSLLMKVFGINVPDAIRTIVVSVLQCSAWRSPHHIHFTNVRMTMSTHSGDDGHPYSCVLLPIGLTDVNNVNHDNRLC